MRDDTRYLPFTGSFEAIWSCASLLYLKRADVPTTLLSFHSALVDNGLLFVAVKRGDGEEMHN